MIVSKIVKHTLLILFVSTLFLSCFDKSNIDTQQSIALNVKDTFNIYTKKSQQINTYKDFNSPNAVNRIADIENEYFNNYNKSQSKYYGTQWYEIANNTLAVDGVSQFEKYKKAIQKKKEEPDSMHCTIYAIEALKAGFGSDFKQLEKQHNKIWKKHEYAGWSIAYILTEKYNWKAYLVLSKQSSEYKSCTRNYKKDKKYHVWKQPDIKIEKVFDADKDQAAIDSLLNTNEFGWGFSEQGWHTWITRFDQLKECNWLGAPAKRYSTGEKPLFIKTKFTEFKDYNSHIVVFPPKNI